MIDIISFLPYLELGRKHARLLQVPVVSGPCPCASRAKAAASDGLLRVWELKGLRLGFCRGFIWILEGFVWVLYGFAWF